jgi:hypothetical protein
LINSMGEARGGQRDIYPTALNALAQLRVWPADSATDHRAAGGKRVLAVEHIERVGFPRDLWMD